MSLLIKGIDMPKYIDELRLIINGMSIAIEPTEAIQIPTPHGRLIDADKVFCYDFMDEQNIDNAPTVIDREEER